MRFFLLPRDFDRSKFQTISLRLKFHNLTDFLRDLISFKFHELRFKDFDAIMKREWDFDVEFQIGIFGKNDI